MGIAAADILKNLGLPLRALPQRGHYQPRIWGAPATRKIKRAKGKGAGRGSGPPDEQRKRELERESRHWRELKEKWNKQLDDAYDEHKAFRRWLDLLHAERKCGMPKPGIVDWDVEHEVQRLGLVKLPIDVRHMALREFGKWIRRVSKRHGYTAADDPFPKGLGPGKDCYTSDWDRVRKELEIR